MGELNSPSMVQGGTKSSVINPLIISMIGIVATAMAILVYHLLVVKYCVQRRAANRANATAAQPNAATRTSTGVDEKILVAIPILEFSVVKRGMVKGECAVCLGELEDEDAVRLLPNCNHAFHVSCIDQWFAAHASCPLCRSPVMQQVKDSATETPNLSVDPNRTGGDYNSAISGIGDPPLPSPPSRGQSVDFLRHCMSLVTPTPPPMERRSWPRLKRSLSMDQSLVVVIDVERGNCPGATSFCSSSRGSNLRRSGSLNTGSLSHLDRVGSKWLRSFSWLRAGKASNAPVLPS